MPASEHTKKADSPKKERQWEHVAASARNKGASRPSQIKQANAAVAKNTSRRKK
jgi:hypothetical protein